MATFTAHLSVTIKRLKSSFGRHLLVQLARPVALRGHPAYWLEIFPVDSVFHLLTTRTITTGFFLWLI